MQLGETTVMQASSAAVCPYVSIYAVNTDALRRI